MSEEIKIGNGTEYIHENLSLENLPDELWKPVIGFEDFYEISNMGRLKSLARTESYPLKKSDPNSKMRTKKYEDKILRQKFKKDKKGELSYLVVPLKGKIKKFAHVLVAQAFIPNPENKPFVNHLKGIKYDNRDFMLEWCTRIENERHSWRELNRQSAKGENSSNARLKTHQVLEIRQRYSEGEMPKSIGDSFGVNRSLISNIVARRTWKHI